MNWKSDKSGNHFNDSKKPGLSSDSAYTKDFHSDHTQSSSIQPPTHMKPGISHYLTQPGEQVKHDASIHIDLGKGIHRTENIPVLKNNGYKEEPINYVGGESTKHFLKAKASAEKYLEHDIAREKKAAENSVNGYSGFAEKDLAILKKLTGYPTSNKEITDLSSVVKGKIIKAELEEIYPNTKFGVRTSFSSVDIEYVSGKYPYGADTITKRYQDDRDSDMMTDYSNTDTYVNVNENGSNTFDTKEQRLAFAIRHQYDEKHPGNRMNYDDAIWFAKRMTGRIPHGDSLNGLRYDVVKESVDVDPILNDNHKEKGKHSPGFL